MQVLPAADHDLACRGVARHTSPQHPNTVVVHHSHIAIAFSPFCLLILLVIHCVRFPAQWDPVWHPH